MTFWTITLPHTSEKSHSHLNHKIQSYYFECNLDFIGHKSFGIITIIIIKITSIQLINSYSPIYSFVYRSCAGVYVALAPLRRGGFTDRFATRTLTSLNPESPHAGPLLYKNPTLWSLSQFQRPEPIALLPSFIHHLFKI